MLCVAHSMTVLGNFSTSDGIIWTAGEKASARAGMVQRSIVKVGVLDRTRETVTQSWFVRTNTIVTVGEEHRCSRTWRNGPRFVGVC